MRRTGVILSVLVMVIALALPALAAGPSWTNQHAHLLTTPSGACVELAAGQIVPVHAHHLSLHVPANSGVFGFERNGGSIAPDFAGTGCP